MCALPPLPHPDHHLELPLDADIISTAAQWLINSQGSSTAAFDFSQQLVLAPSQAIGRKLASAIALHSQQAGILPPKLLTPKQWAQQHQPFIHDATAMQLALATWLAQPAIQQEFRNVVPSESTHSLGLLNLAQTLESLLAELALSGYAIHAASTEQFYATITQASSEPLQPAVAQLLTQQSALVLAAWAQFHQSFTPYPKALAAAVASLDGPAQALLIGFDDLSPIEQQLLQPCSQIFFRQPTNVADQAPLTARAKLTVALQQTQTTLQTRAATLSAVDFATVQLLQADDAEAEAWLACTQIRHWLAEGKTQIMVVAEDREFGRRLRALLERYYIELADRGGWSLATTRVATALERWLQVVEDDAPASELLDVLHSQLLQPAVVFSDNQSETKSLGRRLEQAIYRLEADIMHREGVVQGLVDYQQALQWRRERLTDLWPQQPADDLQQLLTTLQIATDPFADLLDQPAISPHAFTAAVQSSLSTLGMLKNIALDPAGSGIMEALLQLNQLPAESRLSWANWRALLRNQLENQAFRPAHKHAPVVLCNLNQAYLEQADAVLLAAATQTNLPGKLPHTPYFNQRVRQQLGLMDAVKFQTLQQHRFLRLLNNQHHDQDCPITITWPALQAESPALPAAWVEQLLALRQLTLTPAELEAATQPAILEQARHAMLKTHAQRSPNLTRQPSPTPNLPLPATLSASAHQDLIDCPYKFLYARLLGLRAPETIRLVLAKNDFGALVHRCLHAFTTGIDGLPGPFVEPLNDNTRNIAHELLVAIGQRVFARDTTSNIWHLGWQQEYENLLDPYLDWEISSQNDWQWHQAEVDQRQAIIATSELFGRLDRIDANREARYLGGTTPTRIVDYKTGTLPSTDDVHAGEAVQLPTYALLHPSAQRVEYLQLQKSKTRSLVIEDDELLQLKQATESRLKTLLPAIETGAALPANGDPDTCHYCDFAGICRQSIWRQHA